MMRATEKENFKVAVNDKNATQIKKKKSVNSSEKSTKTQKTESLSSAKATARINLDDWINKFLAGGNSDKLNSDIFKLTKDSQGLASEILLAQIDDDSKPSSKFKLEKISIINVGKVSAKFRNAYFLASLIASEGMSIEIRNRSIELFLNSKFQEAKMDYLLNRVGNLKDKATQLQIWEQILTSSRMQGSDWSALQLKVLDWGFSNSLRPIESRPILESWHSASADFKSLETPAKNRIYRKILEIDLVLFWNFLIHIARDCVYDKSLSAIIGQKNDLVILAYLQNRAAILCADSSQFEGKFFSPLLKSRIDEIMELEKLLLFLQHFQILSMLLPVETLPRAIKRCYNKGDELAKLFGDSRVGTLESALEKLTKDSSDLLSENHLLSATTKELESRIKDFEVAMNNYEGKLRMQMNTESAGNAAVVQQGRVELMKLLLDSIDHILNSESGINLERAFQKLGVSKLGVLNEPYPWSDQNCESLTGVAIESGIVVRCGYTWTDGESKTLIRRVLLKSN